jgi:hypothetical protein
MRQPRASGLAIGVCFTYIGSDDRVRHTGAENRGATEMLDHETMEEPVITSESGDRATSRYPVPEKTVSFDEFVRAILGWKIQDPSKESARKKRGRSDANAMPRKRSSSVT